MFKHFVSGALALIAVITVSSLALFAAPVAGAVEGSGTHFEVTDSDYLDITLDSSEPVTVILESVPRAITIRIEAAEGAVSAQLAVSGFEPDTEYHLYQDDYHNHTSFVTDASGSYRYLQDLTSSHLVMIQPYPSTIFLSNSGWSKAGIGTWDAATKTATLTTDISETIEIDDSGITLDGNGHVSATTTLTRGVFIKGNVAGVLVRNLTISGYSYGVDTGNNVSALTLSENRISNCTKGISLFKCDHSIVTGNTVSSCGTGIACQTDRNAVGNTIYRNSFLGNSEQASVSGNGAPFQFSLPAPTGGNYWSNWTSPDSNHDRIVDLPYLFPGGRDDLPWAVRYGWDTLAPTTALSLAGTAGSNGWYRSEVEATLTATDEPGGSGVALTEYRINGGGWVSYAGSFSLPAEGVHELRYRTTDNAGNVEDEKTAAVRIDWTPPTVSGAATTSPNGNGWYNQDITVHFTAADDVSGVDAVTPDVVVSTEGADQSVTGSATDAAGNASDAVTVSGLNLDKTPPTVDGSATSSPNGNGWYNHDVTVTFTGADALSGLDSVTPDAIISTEGADQSVTGTAKDKAGNSSSVTVSDISIDKTPPTISGAGTTSPNGNGWYNHDVTVHFEGADDLSGLASVTPDTTVATEGAEQSVAGTATDRADNTASCTVSHISIDKTPPTISGAATTPPNGNGWYKDDITVHFEGADDLSGLASVTPDTTVATEGADQSVAGTATDLADNTTHFTVTGLNLDKTPPSISAERDPAPNADGWNNSDVKVTFAATDVLSGLDTVTPDVTISTEGADQSVTGTASDLAGNTATVTVDGISIDKTPPTISGAATTPPNGNGWYNHDVTVTFNGSDALSGVETVSEPIVLSAEGAGQSATGSATDCAGNTAHVTVSGLNIDKTPPVITGKRTPEANENGWNNSDVTVTFEAADGVSGVDSVTPPSVTLAAEGAGQSATGIATDRAGNTASCAVSDINIDKTPPTLSGAATTSPNGNGWYNHDITVHFEGADGLSGLASVTPDTTVATEGAGQSVEGTATDLAGNTTHATATGLNLDKTPPALTLITPVADGNYLLHAAVAANWSAADGISGIDTATGTTPSGGPLDTAAPGDHSFLVMACDRAGNQAEKSVVYHVRYVYGGVLPPVNADGRSVFKLGSTVPVKFRLTDANGALVTNATATLYVAKLSNGVLGDELEAVSTAAATTGNLFRCDPVAGQYIFNLSTKPLSAGTWQIRISLNDGTYGVVQLSLR